MPARYFLDTSALLPRYLRGAPGRAWVARICAPDSVNSIAIAEITEAELAAALNQLVRGGVLREKRCNDALALFWSQVAASEYYTISITSTLIRRAAQLCSAYSLKGYDAVQLACGLIWREDAQQADTILAARGDTPLGDPIFLTEDNRLRDAALAEAFIVDSPVNHKGEK